VKNHPSVFLIEAWRIAIWAISAVDRLHEFGDAIGGVCILLTRSLRAAQLDG
jgi:hypothetical protein